MSSTSAQSASRRRTGPVFWAASGWDRRALDRWVESGRGPQVVSATQPAVPYDQHLTRVQEIDTWPDGPQLREFVSRYARLLIPAAESTAGITWGVTPPPGRRNRSSDQRRKGRGRLGRRRAGRPW